MFYFDRLRSVLSTIDDILRCSATILVSLMLVITIFLFGCDEKIISLIMLFNSILVFGLFVLSFNLVEHINYRLTILEHDILMDGCSIVKKLRIKDLLRK